MLTNSSFFFARAYLLHDRSYLKSIVHVAISEKSRTYRSVTSEVMMLMIQMGVHLRHQVTFERMTRLARTCEALTFDHVWIDDHIYCYDSIQSMPYFNSWLVLSGIASVTSRIKLGLLVANVFLLHPAQLLQSALTLHAISRERFILGLGAGWFSGDFKSLGLNKPPFEARSNYLDECCQFLQENWFSEDIQWNGKTFLANLKNYGWSSLLQTQPRLLIGGKHPSIIDIAVRHADELNIELQSETEAPTIAETISRSCDEHGRSSSSLSRSILITVLLTKNAEDARKMRKMHFDGLENVHKDKKIVDNVLIGDIEIVVDVLGSLIDVLELNGIMVIPLASDTVESPLTVLRDEIWPRL